MPKITTFIRKSFPAKLYRFINRGKNVPHLPGGIASPIKIKRLSDDQKILIMAGLAKDERSAAALMEKWNAETALDVLMKEKVVRRRWQERLMDWLRRIEGTLPNDPLPGAWREKVERNIGTIGSVFKTKGKDK